MKHETINETFEQGNTINHNEYADAAPSCTFIQKLLCISSLLQKVTNYQSFHFTGLISVQICFFQFSSPQLLSMGQLTITSLPQKVQRREKFSRYTIYKMQIYLDQMLTKLYKVCMRFRIIIRGRFLWKLGLFEPDVQTNTYIQLPDGSSTYYLHMLHVQVEFGEKY